MRKNIFRLTGFFYLLVIVFAGFSQGYIRETLVVYDNVHETAQNITKNSSLFRLGLSLDLVAFTIDAVISVLLYQLFKPFGKTLAMTVGALRLIAHPAIGSLNLLNHYLAYQVLTDATFLSGFEKDQLESLSSLFIHAHQYGYLIAGAFFGMHCVLLGVLIYRSNTIPNLFGGFLMGSAAGYLLETFLDFNVSGYEFYTAFIVGITAALGEISFALYLLIKGCRHQSINQHEYSN